MAFYGSFEVAVENVKLTRILVCGLGNPGP